MPPSNSTLHGLHHQFQTTNWGVVVQAGRAGSPESQAALEWLSQAYWYPLYAYVRRQGRNVEEAQDLTQEFFHHLLASEFLQRAQQNRGRFRTFLLSSLKNFLVNEWVKANREKRGSGQHVLSLDEELAESRLAAEPATAQPPDALYDRGWAGILMERAMMALRSEFANTGKLDTFERLKVYVWGEKSGLPYATMAGQLDMTEGAVKVTVHRLRQRYGELLRAEVAQTVATPVEVEEELRYLATVIRLGLGSLE
jgi:DNA-directed RNA polymerase specialized sigma24 family protein